MLRNSLHIPLVLPTPYISGVCQNSLLIKQEMQCLFTHDIDRVPDNYIMMVPRSASGVRLCRTLAVPLSTNYKKYNCIFITGVMWGKSQ